MAEGHAGLRGSLLEGIEVDHHHVDRFNALREDGSLVLRVARM